MRYTSNYFNSKGRNDSNSFDLKSIEAARKLLCPEKSMILSYVASGSEAATVHSTRSTPSGLAEENGHNVAQKGDFNGQMSFAGCLNSLGSTSE